LGSLCKHEDVYLMVLFNFLICVVSTYLLFKSILVECLLEYIIYAIYDLGRPLSLQQKLYTTYMPVVVK